jgi:hypothetical protein
MGEFSRLTGVFFEPSKTFADIAQRPTWIIPMLIVLLSGMGVMTAISQHIGWERITRQQLETNTMTQRLTPEQKEEAVARSVKFGAMQGYAGVILGVPIADVIIAAVLLGIAGGIMSGGMRFKQVFAVVCYSGLPGVISAILTVVVMFLKKPDDIDIQNPLAFNLGAFMDPATGSKFVHSLASSMDLFMIWTILLIATGLKAAAGKRLTFTGALVAVAVPWAILILAKSAIVGAFT